MRGELAQKLDAQSILRRENATEQASVCKICGGHAPPFDVVDFNKCASIINFYEFGLSGIAVTYYRCGGCGFIFTHFFDDWTSDDFSAFIYNSDYSKVDPEYEGTRPQRVADHMIRLLANCRDARILDYGAGAGIFADVLRRAGFHRIEAYDPFANPHRPTGKFDLITCFEVIEHTAFPLIVLEDMLQSLEEDGIIILSTATPPAEIGNLRCNWWYVAPRNGHISIFTDAALAMMAGRLGCIFHRGSGLFGYRRAVPGPWVAEVLRHLGPIFKAVTLAAPFSEHNESWHALERQGSDYFRWSKRNTVSWTLQGVLEEYDIVRISIPFMHQAREGMAEQSAVIVNGIHLATRVEASCIVAEGEIIGSDIISVVLSTPPVISPAELRGASDTRMLGIAIKVECET